MNISKKLKKAWSCSAAKAAVILLGWRGRSICVLYEGNQNGPIVGMVGDSITALATK